MNIFTTSDCPIQAAHWLCNKHVTKMGLESCQLLANCFTKEQLSHPDCPRNKRGEIRGHFNPKHPSCIFTTYSKANMRWVIDHAQAIFQEHYERYPLKRHFAHDFLDWVIQNINISSVPDGPLTEFTVAIREDKNCRKVPGFNSLPVIEQYRLYIIYDKPFAVWPNGKCPYWMPQLDTVIDFSESLYESYRI